MTPRDPQPSAPGLREIIERATFKTRDEIEVQLVIWARRYGEAVREACAVTVDRDMTNGRERVRTSIVGDIVREMLLPEVPR